jgi:iron complex transport system substrate-binding protein
MMRASPLIAALCLAAAACAPAVKPVREAPVRIVSLDFCADQFVLKFAPRTAIRALSPDAGRPFSYMRAAAAELPTVRAQTDDLLALRPTVVVRSYGGGPGVSAAMERAGIEVIQLGYPETLADVRAEVLRVGGALGNPAGAQRTAADMDRRLAAIAKRPIRKPRALYMTKGGVTAGPGTLVDDLMRAAGLANFQRRAGWNAIPLERLAYETPDLIAAASFDGASGNVDSWSAAAHPIARAQLRQRPVVHLEGAWTACGGWFLVDAVEALANAGYRAP